MGLQFKFNCWAKLALCIIDGWDFKKEYTTCGCELKPSISDRTSLLQVAGGTDIIKKTLAQFLPATVSTCLVADLHCYDAFPALAALEDNGCLKLRVVNLYTGTLQ